MRVTYLTTEQILAGASTVLGPHHVVRDLGLVESAALRPRATVFGAEAYPSLHEKAAALLHSLVANHPFIDGNKRMGWAATAVFYEVNGHTFIGSDDTAFDLVMDIAKGTESEVHAIAGRLAELFSPG